MFQPVCPIQQGHRLLSEAIAAGSAYGAHRVETPYQLLTQRAQWLGLARPSDISANGSCRMMRCADGWLAINLPREDDADLVPALLQEYGTGDAWAQLAFSLPLHTAASILDQASLLGLAVARVGETFTAQPFPPIEQGRAWEKTPLVLDLSTLWAGPLCGALLAEAGCQVEKVESIRRPDTTGQSSAAFDEQLNGRKKRHSIDPTREADQHWLRSRIAAADVILTSARPRGLQSLGIWDALQQSSAHWIAIGAYPDSQRIGFGDDAAAAGGLVDWVDGTPRFKGDAVADPLTGLMAAAWAFHALATGKKAHQRVCLSEVARTISMISER